MCVSVCVCVCACVLVCVHMCVNVCECVWVSVRVCMRVHVWLWVCVSVYVSVSVCELMFVWVCVFVFVIVCVCVYACVCFCEFHWLHSYQQWSSTLMSVTRRVLNKNDKNSCHQKAASLLHYTTSCKHNLLPQRMGEIIARNMLSRLKLSINLIFLHLIGRLYYCKYTWSITFLDFKDRFVFSSDIRKLH